jgi:hypothetical protein
MSTDDREFLFLRVGRRRWVSYFFSFCFVLGLGSEIVNVFIDTKGLLSASSLEKTIVKIIFVIGLILANNLMAVDGRNINFCTNQSDFYYFLWLYLYFIFFFSLFL